MIGGREQIPRDSFEGLKHFCLFQIQGLALHLVTLTIELLTVKLTPIRVFANIH